MHFFARALGASSLVTLMTAWGCSKENNVSMGDIEVGQECMETADCGPSAVCTLGVCRVGCTNDAECPQETLCVGDQPPYGCTTLDEGACSSANPCPTSLTCGIDGRCRTECAENEDCPRNDQECVSGTCVSHSEAGADETWFACREGEEACVTAEGVPTWGVPLSTAIALAVEGPDHDVANCFMTPEGCPPGSDEDCSRYTYTYPAVGGNSPPEVASVHVMCNVTGPGWQVLADCGTWTSCVNAMSASLVGGSYDYVCSTAENPPLKSEVCAE
ncbi:MAG TPA: hypothetical protein VM686_04055 [Polyangiaceae bacterium]|nr:hypothetical protein [Polyangiaceae bacterium]